MARRKVTMLEAFQRSARESAERAAAERRRVIADREKGIRRAETARSAQELGHRLTQRANDSMGSLLAGIRGGGAAEGPRDGTNGEAGGHLETAPATDINRVPPPQQSPPQQSPAHRGGPALPAFDRATHEDVTEVATGRGSGSTTAGNASHDAAEEDPFGDATEEDVEHAIASLEDAVFELPMSARTFGLLGAAVIAVAFMMGYTVGHTRSVPGTTMKAGLAHGGQDGDGGRQRAAPPPGRARTGPPPSASPPEIALLPTVAAMTPEDVTFQSPAMKFSILAITYTRTDAHAQMAMETYDYLYGEGFPVIHPVERDSRIYVLVGAAETTADLEGLKSELRGLRSARTGPQEFRSAMLVNIDAYR